MKKGLLLCLLLLSLMSCRRPLSVLESRSDVLMIDSTLDVIQDSCYLAYIEPIKNDLEHNLNVAIGYAPKMMIVGQPECTMLNWASDALLAMAQQRYAGKVDISVVNVGGMRCEWAAGNITQKHIFELMPFDNELVVLTMTGEEIIQLCKVFVQRGGEGVAGLRMKSRNGELLSVKIDGKNVIPTAYYTVATSDYLSQGNDGMTPLTRHEELWRSEEKIRDLYIEYVEQVKVVEAEVDGRMDIL